MSGKLSLSLAFLVAVGVVACKKTQDPEPNMGNPPPVTCPPGQYWNGQMCAAGVAPTATTATPPPTTTAPPPPTSPIPTATTGPTAAPLDAVSASAATQALDVLAKQSIPPGAHPLLAQALAGNFQQGQSLETTFNAQPGKCYTLVGSGLPNVQNLDLQIVASSPLPGFGSPILATDQTSSPNAVVAGQPNCFKWALPMAAPLKVVMTVSAGSGIAAAQIYEK
jgi:hypothetical protein